MLRACAPAPASCAAATISPAEPEPRSPAFEHEVTLMKCLLMDSIRKEEGQADKIVVLKQAFKRARAHNVSKKSANDAMDQAVKQLIQQKWVQVARAGADWSFMLSSLGLASARSSSPSWPHLMNCLSHLHCRSPKQDYMSLHCTMRSQRNMHLHGSWTSECHRCQRMAAFATVVAVAGGHLTAPIILRRATGCLMGGHAWAGCAHGFELHSLLYHCCHPNLLIIDEMCSQGAHEWTARHVMSGLNGRGMSEASCLCGVRSRERIPLYTGGAFKFRMYTLTCNTTVTLSFGSAYPKVTPQEVALCPRAHPSLHWWSIQVSNLRSSQAAIACNCIAF